MSFAHTFGMTCDAWGNPLPRDDQRIERTDYSDFGGISTTTSDHSNQSYHITGGEANVAQSIQPFANCCVQYASGVSTDQRDVRGSWAWTIPSRNDRYSQYSGSMSMHRPPVAMHDPSSSHPQMDQTFSANSALYQLLPSHPGLGVFRAFGAIRADRTGNIVC